MTEKDQLPTEFEGEPKRSLVKREPSREISTLLFQDEQAKDADEIDLLAYWRILVKRRWLIASCLGAVLVLGVLMTMLSVPKYRATAVVQVESASQQVLREGDLSGPYSSWDPDFLETQLGLLRSNSLAERVVDDLRIDEAALERLQPPGWLDRVSAPFKSEADTPPGTAPAPKPRTRASDLPPLTPAEVRAMAVATVAAGLTATLTRNTRLIDIGFVSTNPAFAARAANAYADGYIASEIDRRFGASSYAKTYLEEQLAIAKSRLEDSERALVDFAEQEQLVDVGDGASLVGQNLANLNASLAQAQAARIRAESRWNQASAGNSLPQDVLKESLVPTLRQQLAQLQRSYQEKLQVFKPDYPEMLQLKGQIDELEKQVEAEFASARATIRAEYDTALANENMLKEQLDDLRGQTLDTSKRSIQYNILRREADTNRQLYESLLQRYKEVGAASEVRPNNISIVDRAAIPIGPFAPSLTRNLALSFLLGAMLGVGLALLLEFLDDTLKTPEDIEHKLKLPVLGIIPKLGPRKSVAEVAADPRSAFSEAYRSVRTALQFSTDRGIPKILLITSPTPAEGKSTTALTLARNLMQLGKKVLLIEADMRNPSLHRTLATRTERGLSNLLTGNCTLQNAVVAGKEGEPDILLAGPLPPNPAELLAGVRLRVLFDFASQRYDQIVIDGPPVMGIADSPLLAHAGDSTLLIVESGGTRIHNAQAAVKRLLSSRTRVLGVVLTKYDAKIAGYGYQYEGYYAYGGTPRLGRT